jgi:hypothetical protein
MVEIVKSIPRNRTKIVLDPVEEVRSGYCIQPFAYSNASMAIRATAAATPLQKKQIAATVLESREHCCVSSPWTKNDKEGVLVPKATNYVK